MPSAASLAAAELELVRLLNTRMEAVFNRDRIAGSELKPIASMASRDEIFNDVIGDLESAVEKYRRCVEIDAGIFR